MLDIGKGAMRKALRWAARIYAYNYDWFHISGEDNMWLDLLKKLVIPLKIRRIVNIPPLSTTFRAFELLSRADIQASQKRFSNRFPDTMRLFHGFWCPSDTEPIYIPREDSDIQLLVAIISHTGAAGHNGRKSTESMLRNQYPWSTLPDYIPLFFKSCIHCLSTPLWEVERYHSPSYRRTMAPNPITLSN